MTALRRTALLLPISLAAALTFGQGVSAVGGERFSPAAYVTENSRLLVFPSNQQSFTIPIPLNSRYVAFGAAGRTLYVTAFKKSGTTFTNDPGIFKIDLQPVKITRLAGLESFSAVDRLAVSKSEEVVVFAARVANASACGIYALNLADAKRRTVLENPDCRGLGWPWRIIDVSLDAKSALMLFDHRLAVLDLTDGKITSVGRQLWGGSYSPNGKWIAALELAGPQIPSRTTLIDSQNFDRLRDLGGLNDDEVVWSPDSKFILHCVPKSNCAGNGPLALEALDVATGQRTLVKDTSCRIGVSRYIGWVRSDLGK